MTLTQLRYYQAVCKFNGISKASEELHVSQPAVSIAINNLEAEFGVKLLKRDHRSFEITEAGQIFLALTNDLLANADAMYRQMEALQDDVKQLRLGFSSFSYSRLLQPLLRQYQTLAPGTQVKVFECSAKEAAQKLKSGQIDVALTVDSSEHPPFLDGLSLYRSLSVLAVGANHRLAGAKSCSFADLAQESLIFAKEDSRLTTQVKRRFHAMGISPNVFLYSAQSNVIESALQNGRDGAIVADELAKQLKNSVLVPIQDPVVIDHLLLWKRTPQLSPQISKFIKAVRMFYPEASTY